MLFFLQIFFTLFELLALWQSKKLAQFINYIVYTYGEDQDRDRIWSAMRLHQNYSALFGAGSAMPRQTVPEVDLKVFVLYKDIASDF
jgi:hypothetical protein